MQTFPNFTLHLADCIDIIPQLPDNSLDAIFADPPYFLSNGGISVQSGKQVCVDKGDWDKGGTPEHIYNFNRKWLELCRPKLKDNGTIWISGTYHNIFVVQRCLQECGYKILNIITWQKTDPPPNLSCRYFNFSTELIIWARKSPKIPHKFNYDVMKELNGGKQMTDVWRIPSVGKWEKTCGKHPTQKPLRLLYRIILASTNKGDTILDPFAGSCTTGIAANLLERNFIGIDQEKQFIELGQRRRQEIEDKKIAVKLRKKMSEVPNETMVLVNHARKELREMMIEKGLCYLRAGDSKGSLQVTPGFERMHYVLLHTNGEDAQLFRIKKGKEGSFQIWSKETLISRGFNPEHALYYIVIPFENSPIEYSKQLQIKQHLNTFRAKIRPLSDFTGI